MRWPEYLFATRHQPFEAAHIGLHVPIRGRDDGRRPAHDVVTGKQGVLFGEGVAEMVGGVPRGMHGFEGPAVALDALAVTHPHVGIEFPVGAFLDLAASVGPPRTVGSENP